MMQKALCDLRLCLCREHPLYVPSLHVGGNVFLLCHLILADMQQQRQRRRWQQQDTFVLLQFGINNRDDIL